jgi:hypothetical protein
MQFNEDHTPLWEAACQLKVHISTPPVSRQLIGSTGILCETNGRPSFSIHGAAICTKRPTTPIERKDQAEGTITAFSSTSFDLYDYNIPASGKRTSRAQSARERHACTSVILFACRWTVLYARIEPCQRPVATWTSSENFPSPARSADTGTGIDPGVALSRTDHHADAPPARTRRARWRAQLVAAAGALRVWAMRLGCAPIPLC